MPLPGGVAPASGAPVGALGAAVGVLGAALGSFGAALGVGGAVLGVLPGEFALGRVPGWVEPGVLVVPLGVMVAPGVAGPVLGDWLGAPAVLWPPVEPVLPACPAAAPADCATAQAPHRKIVPVKTNIFRFIFGPLQGCNFPLTSCQMETAHSEMPRQSKSKASSRRARVTERDRQPGLLSAIYN